MTESAVWAVQSPAVLRAFLMSGGGVGGEERPDYRTSVVRRLPLFGLLLPRSNSLIAGTALNKWRAAFRAALDDPAVGAIVIDCDSPGGSIYGVEELSAEIFAARGRKPIVAQVNSLMASAAYWICSAASEVVVTPSGELGAIGVFCVHTDVSEANRKAGARHTIIAAGRYKTEANELEPLTAEARAAIQARVDETYARFVNAVARNRGDTPRAVRNGYGEGRLVGARRAVGVGLADRIDTLDATIARLTKVVR